MPLHVIESSSKGRGLVPWVKLNCRLPFTKIFWKGRGRASIHANPDFMSAIFLTSFLSRQVTWSKVQCNSRAFFGYSSMIGSESLDTKDFIRKASTMPVTGEKKLTSEGITRGIGKMLKFPLASSWSWSLQLLGVAWKKIASTGGKKKNCGWRAAYKPVRDFGGRVELQVQFVSQTNSSAFEPETSICRAVYTTIFKMACCSYDTAHEIAEYLGNRVEIDKRKLSKDPCSLAKGIYLPGQWQSAVSSFYWHQPIASCTRGHCLWLRSAFPPVEIILLHVDNCY